jgi:hypothetical protein
VSPGHTPPQYNLTTVEAVILKVVAELHPRHLPSEELWRQIVTHPEDEREVKTATRAIASLKELGLFTARADDIVEPTPAALHAFALLA